MFRIYIPVALLVFFLGWALYRLVVKKDLRKNLNTVYFGLFFVAIWSVIYFVAVR